MKNIAIYTLAFIILVTLGIGVGYILNTTLTVLALYLLGYDSGILKTVLEFIEATILTAQAFVVIWFVTPTFNFLNNHLRGTTK